MVCALGRFVEQDFERWDIGVPFDQRGLGAEAVRWRRDKASIPEAATRVPVGIDQARPACVEAGEVNLGDRIRGYRRRGTRPGRTRD